MTIVNMTPQSNLKPIRARRTLREEVAENLRNSILTGRLKRGTRLDLLGIAEELDVSQLPVREALIQLESEGLVRTQARRGYYVADLSETDFEDHYEIYGKLSGVAAARAATLIDDASIATLDRLNERMRSASDVLEQQKYNQEIHRIINRLGSSHRLAAVLRTLSQGMDFAYGTVIPGWRESACEEHDTILDALRQRDAEAARAAMEEHLQTNGRRAVEAMKQAGFFDTTTS